MSFFFFLFMEEIFHICPGCHFAQAHWKFDNIVLKLEVNISVYYVFQCMQSSPGSLLAKTKQTCHRNKNWWKIFIGGNFLLNKAVSNFQVPVPELYRFLILAIGCEFCGQSQKMQRSLLEHETEQTETGVHLDPSTKIKLSTRNPCTLSENESALCNVVPLDCSA